MVARYNGIWFYGLSGSGKTYIANYLKKKIPNSLLIDGDDVRKFISFDLGYNLEDRKIQIERIYGICKIIINSNMIPLASSVYFNKKLNNLCKFSKILPIRVERKNFELIKNNHKTYRNKKNIVGKDIFYEKFRTKKIYNDNSANYLKKSNFLLKLIE
jgi:adenylylsulfate kinase-like enzyme